MFVRNLRVTVLKRTFLRHVAAYADARSAPDVSAWQLEQFNHRWRHILESVPYYRGLQHIHRLPNEFADWEEFAAVMPTLERSVVKERRHELTSQVIKPQQWRSTGGSTAEPLRIPIRRSECRVAAQDLWLGRSWFGITPADKLFLLWGHSHLLGTGIRGWFNGWKRQTQDFLLGYRRWSAYDLSVDRLRAAGDALLRFRPAYLLGYSTALDSFAQANQNRAGELRGLNLKVVIPTAESFPRDDSVELITKLFGCPVAMEYGAVETGPIAHQQPTGGYTIFWRSYRLEVISSEELRGHHEVLVTSLFPRCLPLIRYRLGDLVEPDTDGGITTHFRTVTGRCNDTLQLPGRPRIHSEAFSHAMKESPIDAFQVVQLSDWEIELRYTAWSELSVGDERRIRDRLERIDSGLQHVRLRRVDSLEKTIAGKTRRVVDGRQESRVTVGR